MLPNDGPEAEVHRLLDALAELIQQVERASNAGTLAATHEQVKAYETRTRQLMDALGTAIHTLLEAQPPAELVERVHSAITSRVRAWSSTSPLFYRIFNTPRHQFDPYEVSNLLIDQQSRGADVAGQMLDNYYLHTSTATTFRLRLDQLARLLVIETQNRVAERRVVRLLNLHTGMGRELKVLLQDRALRQHVHLTCLDTDATALRQARERLAPLLGERAEFQLGDPQAVVAQQLWRHAPYDIIYALNLFDQLSDRRVGALIAGCHRGLQPGGILVFGNFASNMPAHEHALIHWVMSFNIRRRSEETLREILARTPFTAEAVRIETDPSGASFMVTAQRA